MAEYAGAIASRLRFRPAEVELVELAARVHAARSGFPTPSCCNRRR
ncbi:MAG: hypothetical protein WB682_09575 [Candidatus Dormiibacterota bacterium]